VGGSTAPRVVVEGEEVAAGHRVVAAVEIVSHLQTVLCNISSTVADELFVLGLGLDVVAHVTGDSLDVGGSISVVGSVNHLVGGEETKDVVILGEDVNSGKDVLEVLGSVGSPRRTTIDGDGRSVDVQKEVDPGGVKFFHALVVVLGIVNGVHADSVDAKLLEERNIALAVLDVGKGIDNIGGTSWLVVDTTEVEPLITDEKRIALDRDGLDRGASGGEGSNGCRERSVRAHSEDCDLGCSCTEEKDVAEVSVGDEAGRWAANKRKKPERGTGMAKSEE